MNYIIKLSTQLSILIVLIFIAAFCIFCIRKNILFKKANETPKTHIILWIVIPIISFIFINVFFLWAKNNVIVFESTLSYENAQITLCTVISTICIAFFQYKTQKRLEEKNKIEAESAQKKIDSEKELNILNHNVEMISERIREIKGLTNIEGIAINFLIKDTHANYENSVVHFKHPSAVYFISLDTFCSNNFFYPEYFKVINEPDINIYYKKDKVCKEKGIALSSDLYDCTFNCKKLQIIFKENSKKFDEFNKIMDFFKFPVLNPINSTAPSLIFEAVVHAEDKSVYDNCNKKNLSINFKLIVEIGAASGYNRTGSFKVQVFSFSIENLNTDFQNVR